MSLRPFPIAAAALLLAAAASLAQTTPEAFKALAWDTTRAGTPLDLGWYTQTFLDNFDVLDVTADDGPGPWFAPRSDPFGVARLVPPGSNGPFSVADGRLTIRAVRTVAGKKTKWTTGCMQTVNGKGRAGFVQAYGYFEMRAKFPPGKSGWPAFWLKSQNCYTDPTRPYAEIDVIEWYSSDAKGLHAAVHIHPGAHRSAADPIQKEVALSFYYSLKDVTPPVLTDGKLEGFHTYGAEVTPEWVITYFDRLEIARFPTLPEWKVPLYMLVDLAVYAKDADTAESPKDLVVDYVAAYALTSNKR